MIKITEMIQLMMLIICGIMVFFFGLFVVFQLINAIIY